MKYIYSTISYILVSTYLLHISTWRIRLRLSKSLRTQPNHSYIVITTYKMEPTASDTYNGLFDGKTRP